MIKDWIIHKFCLKQNPIFILIMQMGKKIHGILTVIILGNLQYDLMEVFYF